MQAKIIFRWWKRHTIICPLYSHDVDTKKNWSRVWHFCFIISHIWWQPMTSLGSFAILCKNCDQPTIYSSAIAMYAQAMISNRKRTLNREERAKKKVHRKSLLRNFHTHSVFTCSAVRIETHRATTFTLSCCLKISISIAVLQFYELCTNPKCEHKHTTKCENEPKRCHNYTTTKWI